MGFWGMVEINKVYNLRVRVYTPLQARNLVVNYYF